MTIKNITFIGLLLLFFHSSFAQYNYPDNEKSTHQDMLTPSFYKAETTNNFRIEVNKMIYFAQSIPFQHPLANQDGTKPSFTIRKNFGDGNGPTKTEEHHPAVDMYISGNSTKANIYAAHDGIVKIYKDAPKYRHYISITKDIKDSNQNTLGKLTTIYAHLDLDLDSTENLSIDGKWVYKGELISKNLYANTVGGAHLHFETRYYRPGETGNEEFYGLRKGPGGNTGFTEASAGKWTYGFWHPTIGYGYGNPENHLNQTSNVIEKNQSFDYYCFPNPVKDILTIKTQGNSQNVECKIYDTNGQLLLIQNLKTGFNNINIESFKKGMYYLTLVNNETLTGKIITKL